MLSSKVLHKIRSMNISHLSSNVSWMLHWRFHVDDEQMVWNSSTKCCHVLVFCSRAWWICWQPCRGSSPTVPRRQRLCWRRTQVCAPSPTKCPRGSNAAWSRWSICAPAVYCPTDDAQRGHQSAMGRLPATSSTGLRTRQRSLSSQRLHEKSSK